MKQLLVFFMVIILSGSFYTCNNTSEYSYAKDKWIVHNSNDLLYNKAFVHCRVNIENEFHPQWLGNFKGNVFINNVFEQVFTRKIKVSDPRFDVLDTIVTIDLNSINERLDFNNDTSIHTNEIKSIGFNENWFFDAKNFNFTKHVNIWFPVRHYFGKNDTTKSSEQLKKVFSIHCSDSDLIASGHFDKAKYKSIAKNIRSEFSYSVDNNQDYQGLNFLGLINSIADKILKNQIPVYDPKYVDDLKLVPIKQELIKEKYEDILTKYRFEITTLIFDEDWYLDQATLKIEKFVNGVVLVREFYKENTDDTKIKKTLFYVQFNKNQPI